VPLIDHQRVVQELRSKIANLERMVSENYMSNMRYPIVYAAYVDLCETIAPYMSPESAQAIRQKFINFQDAQNNLRIAESAVETGSPKRKKSPTARSDSPIHDARRQFELASGMLDELKQSISVMMSREDQSVTLDRENRQLRGSLFQAEVQLGSSAAEIGYLRMLLQQKDTVIIQQNEALQQQNTLVKSQNDQLIMLHEFIRKGTLVHKPIIPSHPPASDS
jgi:hypothetical protein